jgi:hypothetical protein
MNLIQCFYGLPLGNSAIESTNSFNASIERRLILKGIPIETIQEKNKVLYDIEPSSEHDSKEIPIQPVKKKRELSLDEKLEIIIESTKYKTKQIKQEKKCKISRKTKDQLAVLRNELLGGKAITKERINELAGETGLTTIQIYKWFWDCKNSIWF